ncbi:hypothetical protein PsorP6_005619 [Peronosclerospora sorghi]|uniref:Uncharacterized protein n=1 Tax=Peronosclerospora sorghi TaxID=230839 RepID=A0ACC0W4Q2_9STRA|nr:hypothetical protein PsorP6_005619 [Peronosclerospora sorghi]
MPLFHVIGLTGLNTSFSVCFTFLSGEEIGDYKWALEKIENLFFGQQIPPVIVTDSYGALAAAIQEVAQHSRHLLCLWHIENNVLANSKKHIVNGDDHKEFMMSWASVCLQERIAHMVQSQVAEFHAAEATQRMRIPHTVRAVPDYANLVGKFSLHAMHLIEKQRSLVIQASATRIPLPDCQEVFGNTMGLPCAHQIANNEPIGLNAIAKH